MTGSPAPRSSSPSAGTGCFLFPFHSTPFVQHRYFLTTYDLGIHPSVLHPEKMSFPVAAVPESCLSSSLSVARKRKFLERCVHAKEDNMEWDSEVEGEKDTIEEGRKVMSQVGGEVSGEVCFESMNPQDF